MSSKFSGRSKVQKPPAVCRAPPVPPIIPAPPFDERYWQAFAFWDDLFGSESVAVSNYFKMKPTADPNTWLGQTPSDDYWIKLKMIWVPGSQTIQTHLCLMLGSTEEDTRYSPPRHPQKLDPFDSGFIQYLPAEYSGAITARILL